MMLSNWSRHVVVVLAVIGCFEVEVQAQTLKETFLASGVTRKVGGYRPIRSEMDKESDIVKVASENLEAPRYGLFEIGDQSWRIYSMNLKKVTQSSTSTPMATVI